MLNKLKVVAFAVVAVVGMVIYKRNFDMKEAAEKKADRRSRPHNEDRSGWN